ncbi:MAG: exo-alpha-sialidase [Verrucomicrobia bacterium]|nr:exo-alpha-sialidase [Verrucomicrobiota bacterium]NBU11383.1 exo-alpha-sialidase [Pseudomonadota bacterium]NDB76302.1 exo-alpha-sialidase [Verrucomicrobiota bacterium]NDF00893.1 exo-alpha-sialidase [Verrucomicrobiota bacterium]
MNVKLFLACLLAALCAHAADNATPAPAARLTEHRKIWDAAPHNAFTDLVRFNNRWYCVFREGSGHVSPDGAVRVLTSDSGYWWESVARIEMPGFDLRDPKITVMPGNARLMILGGATVREGNNPATENQSFVALSDDGKKWGKVFWVGPTNSWLWRVTWHRTSGLGVAYDVTPASRAEKKYGTTLLLTKNGVDYDTLVPDFLTEGGPTEATLRVSRENELICLQRRDGKGTNTAMLGISKQIPYDEWVWKDLGKFLGGPNFIQIPDGRWIACGRLHNHGADKKPKTVVCELDVAKGELTPLLDLPSGGDSSYPGMVWHEGQLWITYYSSHEGKTAIYLARVKL